MENRHKEWCAQYFEHRLRTATDVSLSHTVGEPSGQRKSSYLVQKMPTLLEDACSVPQKGKADVKPTVEADQKGEAWKFTVKIVLN